jgi:hypothetical protein
MDTKPRRKKFSELFQDAIQLKKKYDHSSAEEQQPVKDEIQAMLGMVAPFLDASKVDNWLDNWESNTEKFAEIEALANKKEEKEESPLTTKAKMLDRLQAEYEGLVRRNPERQSEYRMIYEQHKKDILES